MAWEGGGLAFGDDSLGGGVERSRLRNQFAGGSDLWIVIHRDFVSLRLSELVGEDFPLDVLLDPAGVVAEIAERVLDAFAVKETDELLEQGGRIDGG